MNIKITDLNQIKLFTRQPKFTEADVDDLTERGLLTPEKSVQKSTRRECEIANPTAGNVARYNILADKLKNREVSEDDARRLLVIETCRPNGRPRQTHIDRLLVAAFAEEKSSVLSNIENVLKERHGKGSKD